MAKRADRTRTLGAWTEAKYWGTIRSLLRGGFRFWRPMAEAKRRAKRGKHYMCAACGGLFGSQHVQVDHIIPCGSLRCLEDLPGFVERLTPESPSAFQVLCKECHAQKTAEDRATARRAKDMEHG